MTTQLAPHRTNLPPPHRSELSAAGRAVGWVSDGTIGFRGFANEDDAMAAAWMAHRTLVRRRARRDGTRPIPIDVEPLALARDGHEERILAGGREVATLVRPHDASHGGSDSFGFEIHLPAPDDAGRMRDKAALVYRTLRRSGIRWSMWRADDRGPQARSDASRAPHAADTLPPAHVPHAASEGIGAGPDGPASGPSAHGASTGWGRTRPHHAALSVGLAILVAAILLPLATPSFVVSALGGIAAVIALVALAALVRLVVTDVWPDLREAVASRTRRGPRAANRSSTIARRRHAAVGSLPSRMAAVAAMAVIVALVARPLAVTQPITAPVVVIGVAGLAAAAVGAAHGRWQPRRTGPAHRATVADRSIHPDHHRGGQTDAAR